MEKFSENSLDSTGRDNKSRHIIAELNAGKRLRAELVEYYVNSENFISNVNHDRTPMVAQYNFPNVSSAFVPAVQSLSRFTL